MKTNKIILFISFLFISSYLMGQALSLHYNSHSHKKENLTKSEEILLQNKNVSFSDSSIENDTVQTGSGAESPTRTANESNPLSFNGQSNFTFPLFPGATVVPNINIVGDYKISEDNAKVPWEFGMNLYGGQKIGDDNIKNQEINMLIREPSYFGLGMHLATNFIINKSFVIGLNLNADYCSRNIKLSSKDTTQSKMITPSAFIIKFGTDLILFNNVSLYFNWNANLVVTGIDSYESYFKRTTTNMFYFDAGIKGLLGIPTSSGQSKDESKIQIDFGCIIVNPSLQNFTGITDKIIAMIRLAYILPVNTKK